jgi:hypothetical protein
MVYSLGITQGDSAMLLDLHCDRQHTDPYLRAILDKAAKDSSEGYHSWALRGLDVAFKYMANKGTSLVLEDVKIVSDILARC